MNEQFYTLRGAANLLKLRPHQIWYLLSINVLQEPRLRVAGKRVWTVDKITAAAIEIEKLHEAKRQKKEKNGRE